MSALGIAAALLALMGAQSPEAPRGLGHTFDRLAREKRLTIGYFGGSITEGAGASDAAKTSWRALTTAWFRQQFPQAAVTEINAAIGGTGSDLGAFRLEKDLLAGRPDLVFVEFAVNDGGSPEAQVLRAMEGIVRRIRKADPQTDIVFVYTTTQALAPAYDAGGVPAAIRYDQRIADHYGLPTVNVGRPLWQAIHDGRETWQSLTIDTVHPNDRGYALYAEVVTRFLKAHRGDRPAPRRRLPKPLTDGPFENGKLTDAGSADAPGWAKEEKSLAGRYPRYIACDKPGSELVWKFSGPVIGLYWMMAPDSGDIEWSVDGSAPQRASAWDVFAQQYARANYVLLADSLAPGAHTLRLRVLGEKQPPSKGNWIRIGAFLSE